MRLFTLAILMLLASPVFAEKFSLEQGKFYVGGGVGFVDIDGYQGENFGAKFKTVEVLGGYKLNGLLCFEGRVGEGVGSEKIYFNGAETGGTGRLNAYGTVYWRPEAVSKTSKLYALVGYTRFLKNFEDNAGFSYGVGLGFRVNKRWNVNVEYRVLVDIDEHVSPTESYSVRFTAANLNADYRF